MAVRTAYPALESPGDVLTSSNFNRLPGGWIGYAEVTANQGSITAEVDLTSLTVTVTVNSSRRISITGAGNFGVSVANDRVIMNIKEGATVLTSAAGTSPIAAVGTSGMTLRPQVVLTPTAGSHSYKLSGQDATGGTAQLNATSTAPAFILVEDLGPAA